MRVYRHKPDNGWTQISNQIARDHTMRLTARALLIELLSYPDGWDTNVDTLAASSVEGEHVFRGAMKELIARGYARRTKIRGERGRCFTVLEVTDVPGRFGTTQANVAEEGSTEARKITPRSPRGDSPGVGATDGRSIRRPEDRPSYRRRFTKTEKQKTENLKTETPSPPAPSTTARPRTAPERDGERETILDGETPTAQQAKAVARAYTAATGRPATSAHADIRRRAEFWIRHGHDPAWLAEIAAGMPAKGWRDFDRALDYAAANEAPRTQPSPSTPEKRPWCGECDSDNYRFELNERGSPVRPCPRCGPRAALLPDPGYRDAV